MRRQGAIGASRGRVASNHDLAGELFEMQRARQPVGNAVASSDAVALKVIRAASLTPFRRPWPDCARKAQSGLAVCARRGLRDTAGGYLIVRETLSFKGRSGGAGSSQPAIFEEWGIPHAARAHCFIFTLSRSADVSRPGRPGCGSATAGGEAHCAGGRRRQLRKGAAGDRRQ